jgi:hypothetical protein
MGAKRSPPPVKAATLVMAGLVPAIHVFLSVNCDRRSTKNRQQDVDGRDKARP